MSNSETLALKSLRAFFSVFRAALAFVQEYWPMTQQNQTAKITLCSNHYSVAHFGHFRIGSNYNPSHELERLAGTQLKVLRAQ